LVTGVDHDEAKLALVEMFGHFAGRVDAWLLAEGVENVHELAAVTRLGVPLAQGYVLGRPASGWAVLPSEVRQQLIRAAAVAEERHTVEPFVEPWPFLEEGRELEGLQLVREALEPGSQMLSVLPVLDRYRRPVSIYSVSAAAPARTIAQVKATTRVTDAARRAMTRPYQRRFDPMACVDDAGTCLGVVRVERLIEALTSALDGHEPGRARSAA
ncbi:MAG: EAL domain-containing protein, partial [Dehalococcoidia bacterium]|nr:EAL domain-containing protein [Dehalococcoidia bacterium]